MKTNNTQELPGDLRWLNPITLRSDAAGINVRVDPSSRDAIVALLAHLAKQR